MHHEEKRDSVQLITSRRNSLVSLVMMVFGVLLINVKTVTHYTELMHTIFLSQSEADLLVCLQSLPCCTIYMWQGKLMTRQSPPRIIVPLIIASCPGPEAGAPDLYTTTTMFDSWYDVLFIKHCVSFMSDITGLQPFHKSSSTESSPHTNIILILKCV